MTTSTAANFIEEIIDDHIASGKWGAPGDRTVVKTRFPPEPNGYLHIGHPKSICLNFGLAQKYGGSCVLRFDDTNPAKEEQEFVDSIIETIKWLGYSWEGEPRFASDYFEQMYEWAQLLIRAGKAFVCDMTGEEMRNARGTATKPGTNSPYRDRSPEENLDLLARMRAGEFPDGAKTLRAKIDMASPNFNLRDPVMYRILRAHHHRTGDAWCIYPSYDWAHGLEDSIEGITHSICTLEFENHRPLYNWFIDAINAELPEGSKIHHAQQIEFSKLAFTHTVTSKRRLRQLVEEGHVRGWDDPRMSTVAGVRRRGYPAAAIRNLCEEIGVTKFEGTIDLSKLENACRSALNPIAPRRLAVLDPIKLVIENYPEGQVEMMDAVNNPEDESAGSRQIPFSGELLIEREDFMVDAPKKFFRLAPGREVRLRYGYLVTCTGYETNDAGEVTLVKCTYDPDTRGGNAPDGRKVKGTIHWLSADHAIDAEVRLYDRLFNHERPDRAPKDAPESWSFIENLNPDSLTIVHAKLEPALADLPVGEVVQFERTGYFARDPDEGLVFNRTVSLKDSWSKQAGKD